MRLTYGLVSSSVLMLGLVGGGCSNLADDCANTSSCPSGGASSAGSSGASGKSGSSGSGSDLGGESGSSTGGSSSGTAGSSGSSGDAGSGGGGGGDCDVTASPAAEACLVSDDYAVFVAPDGSDDAAGTQAAPFASLTRAVETAGDKLVLVCSGNYDEHVSVTAGVRVFGGFACDDWSSVADKPLFKPTTAGPALSIDTVTDEVLIENVAFEVGDAVAAGATALTAVVNASANVTLRAVLLTAGKGKAGASGTLTSFTFPDRSELDGNNANGTTGGQPKVVECPGAAETSGGIGGAAAPGGQSGGPGTPDLAGPGGEGGTPGSDCVAGVGRNGGNAPDSPAAAGASVLGALTPVGWSSGSGGDGQNGSPGQGGGGGASSKTGGGGGGGAGACGGAGAKGGQGGGGSIAIAVLDSTVSIDASELVTNDAGGGGGSVAGQPGDKDEGGFGGLQAAGACSGGSGGLGGNGGAGGGGAGGISVGVLWQGDVAPTVSANTTIVNGEAGAKGTGGSAGNNDGIAGVSQKVLELP
ncbi:MAG TPA: hypothetical protein VJN18_20975 [Polyangiaceae bacterium]|nr:hypothetical protein [Polyangiaceae bacterium]